MDRQWFRVVFKESFHDDMVGMLVNEKPNTCTLEFPFSGFLGGTQKVEFYKYQLVYEGVF